MNLTYLFVLLVAYQVKHFVADFPLQTEYMLGKFKEYGWQRPLLAHVAVHAAGTFLITCWFGWVNASMFAVIDAACHFTIDRIKADRKLLGRFKPLTADTYVLATDDQRRGNRFFWYALGGDQALHHLTHYGIVAWIAFHYQG
jgi:hypothetical protein